MKKNADLLKRKKIFISRLVPRLVLIFLSFLILIGLLSTRPSPIIIQNATPELPKILVLRLSPTPTPKEKKGSIVPKANAQEVSANNFCVTLPVLFYHHVQPMYEAQKLGHPQFTVDSTFFDTQMQYLKDNGYKTISVDKVVEAIRAKKTFSEKTVALTFDDGYSDIYAYAYPVLKKYGFIGNFAIPMGLIGNNDYLTSDQLKLIAQDSDMYIYNHSWTHAYLAKSTIPTLDSEILTTQNEIQQKLGRRSNIFIYPYGEFDENLTSFLKTHGYIAAFSTLPGSLQCESDLMFLHRTRIGNAPLSSYGL